jgi:hypothetical protein
MAGFIRVHHLLKRINTEATSFWAVGHQVDSIQDTNGADLDSKAFIYKPAAFLTLMVVILGLYGQQAILRKPVATNQITGIFRHKSIAGADFSMV